MQRGIQRTRLNLSKFNKEEPDDMIDLRKALFLISVSFFFVAGAALLLVGTFSYVIGTAKINIPISVQ